MPPRKKKPAAPSEPKLHKELQGFSIEINTFGEITSNLPLEKINQFLNKHVEDKKLTDEQKGESDTASKK
jgi:hypothetical protein